MSMQTFEFQLEGIMVRNLGHASSGMRQTKILLGDFIPNRTRVFIILKKNLKILTGFLKTGTDEYWFK